MTFRKKPLLLLFWQLDVMAMVDLVVQCSGGRMCNFCAVGWYGGGHDGGR